MGGSAGFIWGCILLGCVFGELGLPAWVKCWGSVAWGVYSQPGVQSQVLSLGELVLPP